jgi:acetylornithine deacetylase
MSATNNANLLHVENAALAALDQAALLETLTDLIAIPSVGGTAAEVEIVASCAERARALGLEVDHWPLDLRSLRVAEDYPGEEVDRPDAWGLVATSPGAGPPAMILAGHLDVVPTGELTAWDGNPFGPQVCDGDVTGRGSCDMKGGVTAMLAAAGAVQASGVPLDRRYALHFLIGEEDGGLGAFATLRRGHRGDACIIPEPTNLELMTANAGALTFRIEVPGLATHGSTPYAGSSALDSYLAVHAALQGLQRRRNRYPEPLMVDYRIPYPLSIGRVRAGDWASSVPDLLVAEGRYGLRIDEDPKQARIQLEQVVAQVAQRDPYLRDHPPRVQWHGGQFRGGALAPGHRLRDLVGTAHADVTAEPAPGEVGAPYGSDLRLYTGAGVPTLQYGPGDPRLAHGPHESVPIAEVITAARTLIVTLLRACGPAV